MVGGQMADVHGEFGNDDGNCIDELETSPAITEPLLTLEAIHRSKTGALLDASLRIGAVIAGIRRSVLTHLTVTASRSD